MGTCSCAQNATDDQPSDGRLGGEPSPPAGRACRAITCRLRRLAGSCSFCFFPSAPGFARHLRLVSEMTIGFFEQRGRFRAWPELRGFLATLDGFSCESVEQASVALVRE
jgi:hypothetical protein